jgi:N4-gp56 family major capsid protein
MAKTTYSTSNALTRKVWQEKLFRDSVKDSFFKPLMGSDTSSCVHVKTDFEKQKGDSITFGLRMRLQGSGVTGSAELQGNEESLTTYDFSVPLERYRHAVRDDGALTRQRTAFDIPEESRSALKDWMTEKMDLLAFDALGLLSSSSVNPSKIFYRNSSGVVSSTGTPATARTGLDATNSKLNPDLINALKTWAKTGGNRAYVPLRPLRVDGEDAYVLLVHPDCLYDLESDSTFLGAQRDAMERSKTNPLFVGAKAYWRGVIIRAHENCAIATNGGGGSVAWAKCAFLGAQALAWSWGERPDVVAETFDYQEQQGYAIRMTCGVKKTAFNSLDFGSLGVYLARTNVSGL